MLSTSRWKQLEECFAHASELPDEEREAFLSELKQSDPAMHAEVRSLLESARGARDRLLGAVATQAEALAADYFAPRIGQSIGPYRLVSVIGEGGMGVVYEAERADGQYQHQVAIKVLQERLVSPQIVARFRDERRILAALEHPGIVRLLDGGTTEQGLPYIVMEYVSGVCCTRYVRDVSVRQRVGLMVRVCEAVQHAHQRLVVHRDIKPSNILVTAHGVPKLLDFGIAKLLDPVAANSREARTRTGVALLTPEYASPEQARGDPVSVGTDVYSLGAVLFELLVGLPPQVAGDTFRETLYRICEAPVPLPSSVADGTVAKEIAGDLDGIVLKALQKDVHQRYSTVADLASDLRRFLDGLPVSAREATLRYRTSKFLKRHQGRIGLAAVIVTALLATTTISIQQARHAKRQTRILMREQGVQELANDRPARALPFLIELAQSGSETPALRFLLAEALRPLRREILTLPSTPEGVSGVAWSPDGTRIAITAHGPLVRMYAVSGRLIASLDAGTTDLRDASFSPDGKQFAASGSDGKIHIWNVDDQRLHLLLEGDGGSVVRGMFSPSGTAYVASDRDGYLRVWRLSDGRQIVAVPARTNSESLEWSLFGGNEEWIAAGYGDGLIALFSATTGEKLHELHGHRGPIRRLCSSHDGTRLFSASADGTARIWDSLTGASVATLTGHSFDVRTVEMSPNGELLVTGSYDNTAKVWDAKTGSFVAALLGHANNGIEQAHFSSDSRRIVTTGGDNMFRLWDAYTGEPQAAIEASPSAGGGPGALGRTVDARFSPDGEVLVTGVGTQVKLWRTGVDPLISMINTPSDVHAAAFAPDETMVAGAGADGLVAIWDVRSGAQIARMNGDGIKWWDVAWHPKGKRVLVVGESGSARVYSSDGGDALVAFTGHGGRVNRGSFHRDGERALTASSDKTAAIWDARSGALIVALEHPESVMSAAWSPDGARIATACWDHFLRLWDAKSGLLLQTLPKGPTQLLDVSFSHDGTRLAAAGHDGEVTLWSIQPGERYLTLHGHSGPVTTVTWSPDDSLLATSADDQTVRIWHAASGTLLGTRLHRSSVMQAMWNAAGERILTASIDHTIRVWDAHGEDISTSELAGLARRLPWRLVDGQLELVTPSAEQQ